MSFTIGMLVICQFIAPVDAGGVGVLTEVQLKGTVLSVGARNLLGDFYKSAMEQKVLNANLLKEVIVEQARCVGLK